MTLDPIIARFVAAGRGAARPESLSPTEARAAMRGLVAPLLARAPPHERIEDVDIAGPGGQLTLRILRPDTAGPHPVVLFLHGGGWMVCDLDTHQPLAAELCRGSGAAVVMVDYRLAPEQPFPAAIDDSIAALDWVAEQGLANGLDSARIVVAGDSAGGNLAAVVARRIRDQYGEALAGQYLIYPVTDLPDPDRYPSYLENGEDYGPTLDAMAWYWSNYAGKVAPGHDAIPMLTADLAGLAPALVQTAQYDALRDEGEAYAARLAAAGVAVSVARYPGMIHGFLAMSGVVPGADAAIAQGCAWLRQRFA